MSVGEDPRAALTAAGLDGALIDSVLTDEVAGFAAGGNSTTRSVRPWSAGVAGRARDLASA